MAKILLVEDDLELAERMQDWFTLENHALEVVHNGGDALQMLGSFEFDVIVLDWGLPGVAGIDVLRTYRKNGGTTPIIFLTGRGEIINREEGLDSGADDYMVKPFDVRELSARIRSLLRRPKGLLPTELTIQGLHLELETRTAKAGANAVHLMPKQCSLLEFLMRHPNRPFGAKALLDAVWPSESEASEDTVRTCMKTLRRQLANIGKEDLIKTVLGSGYLIEDKVEDKKASQ
ncbi:MAG: response regulator transcription factor [Candidatus Obscuribacter sp.]|jgi:DNA-binding response OmpR family regulator|nr:response regulator transcription factor [Candidatus Obscuribacter sp.]MDQ5966007.1 Response regulator transcription factor [Cyanobacteriota bacterium erpe_2018_sw_39hr_WHONDRS-SW48-000098_B_bin.30]MBK7838136.1 response regulator transcription factor [Candidatus Obscuribacter sp.]MBK9203640.1 response regulator transcription factor [Candidatus Obscuribacter sp.]MBK9621989.1 response regulator transcription factor [Candidatus Obscuribacter sp.]